MQYPGQAHCSAVPAQGPLRISRGIEAWERHAHARQLQLQKVQLLCCIKAAPCTFCMKLLWFMQVLNLCTCTHDSSRVGAAPDRMHLVKRVARQTKLFMGWTYLGMCGEGCRCDPLHAPTKFLASSCRAAKDLPGYCVRQVPTVCCCRTLTCSGTGLTQLLQQAWVSRSWMQSLKASLTA